MERNGASSEAPIQSAVAAYEATHFEYDLFRRAVCDFFQRHPALNASPQPAIHSIKSRMKDPNHLHDKLVRKAHLGQTIDEKTVLSTITDLAGVRVLHLHQGQLAQIHREIEAKVASGDWWLAEAPVAYSWDPEAQVFYAKLGIKAKIKPSYYTSVHYVVRPKRRGNISCEIQVRTLFEEIWGEIDHTINYPEATTSLPCREQLRVLAKLISTGTRLADAIFLTHEHHAGNGTGAPAHPSGPKNGASAALTSAHEPAEKAKQRQARAVKARASGPTALEPDTATKPHPGNRSGPKRSR
jgi:putative GTP pyrophosphokinase